MEKTIVYIEGKGIWLKKLVSKNARKHENKGLFKMLSQPPTTPLKNLSKNSKAPPPSPIYCVSMSALTVCFSFQLFITPLRLELELGVAVAVAEAVPAPAAMDVVALAAVRARAPVQVEVIHDEPVGAGVWKSLFFIMLKFKTY
jgi:hypothetical protein